MGLGAEELSPEPPWLLVLLFFLLGRWHLLSSQLLQNLLDFTVLISWIAAPDNSLLGLAELPLVTGPNSRVPVIYRWDLDTYTQAIGDGSNPTYNQVWAVGGDPLGGAGLTDLTNPPTVIETDNLAGPGAGGPAGDDGSDGSATAPPATDPPANEPLAGTPAGDDSSSPATEPLAAPPAGDDGASDSGSDSGCTICGLGGCVCS